MHTIQMRENDLKLAKSKSLSFRRCKSIKILTSRIGTQINFIKNFFFTFI